MVKPQNPKTPKPLWIRRDISGLWNKYKYKSGGTYKSQTKQLRSSLIHKMDKNLDYNLNDESQNVKGGEAAA